MDVDDIISGGYFKLLVFHLLWRVYIKMKRFKPEEGAYNIYSIQPVADNHENFVPEDEDEDVQIIFVTNNQQDDIHVKKLKTMFPNVHPQYIKSICSNPPFDVQEGDDLLTMLINHLLSYGEEYYEESISESNQNQNIVKSITNQSASPEQILSTLTPNQAIGSTDRIDDEKMNEQLAFEFLEKERKVIDDRIETLVNILPDANPEYLRSVVEVNHEDVVSLEHFIESRLTNRNYEKRDKYFAKIKMREKIEHYTIGFNVENFVKEFPEPFEHFLNPERQCAFQEKALQFLKNRHAIYQESFVLSAYVTAKHNLSIADKQLQLISNTPPPIQTNIQIENIPLLQEIAFIQNQGLIQNYLDEIKKREEKEIKLLRAQNLLLECQCCFDDVKPTDFSECNNNHIFCQRCIIKGTELAISNGETSVRCFSGCNQEIDLNTLRNVVPSYTFDKFLKKRQEFEVMAANLDDLVTCPFCPYSMELAPQIQIFTCKNPECMKITCRMCKRKNHLPIKCEDVIDEHKGRLFLEEQMTKTLVRYCPNCNIPFVKEFGCNKMTCCKCRLFMCYICKQRINGYDHFINNKMCNTDLNSDVFDRRQMELVRKEATAQLLRLNPDLRIPKI